MKKKRINKKNLTKVLIVLLFVISIFFIVLFKSFNTKNIIMNTYLLLIIQIYIIPKTKV